jgi:protein-S-isoprenylcysteine O-methyltransferase Ste14
VIWLTGGVFALAVAVNCASVHAQKRHRVYDRLGRWGWPAHIALLVLVWGAAIACMALLVGKVTWSLPGWVKPIGLALGVAGSLMFGAAIRELGIQSLFNGNFFGRASFTDRGIYRVLSNPMYDAYCVLLVSLALRRADAVYLLLAVESFIGLNVIEARIERIDGPEAARPPGCGIV